MEISTNFVQIMKKIFHDWLQTYTITAHLIFDAVCILTQKRFINLARSSPLLQKHSFNIPCIFQIWKNEAWILLAFHDLWYRYYRTCIQLFVLYPNMKENVHNSIALSAIQFSNYWITKMDFITSLCLWTYLFMN